MTTGNEIVNLVFGVWMEDAFQLKLAALGGASVILGVANLRGWLQRLGGGQAGQAASCAGGLAVEQPCCDWFAAWQG